ncbi:MAG: hypothetical protein JWM28_563 [Chitinophagaceae bacterium]|nr:hypothetical protein [Chitinophagaceae bacterium]
MKKTFLLFSWVFVIGACNKPVEPPAEFHPKMKYINLDDTTVAFNHFAFFDLDGNGEKDVLFSTLFVGDPLYEQDKKQWLVTSSFNANLPVSDHETIPMLSLLDSVPINDFSGYHWYNASSIVLAQKIIGVTSPPYWEGEWKEAINRFVPIQLKKGGTVYNGWIEVSFRLANEMIILHRAAVCVEANKTVKAGK